MTGTRVPTTTGAACASSAAACVERHDTPRDTPLPLPLAKVDAPLDAPLDAELDVPPDVLHGDRPRRCTSGDTCRRGPLPN